MCDIDYMPYAARKSNERFSLRSTCREKLLRPPGTDQFMYVVSGSTSQRLGAALAGELGGEFCGVISRHFPDGERYVRILQPVKDQDVVVVQNSYPTTKIVELLLVLDAARQAEARSVTCVIPYMGYARQDKVFKQGESLSARAIASAVGGACDKVVAVNLHESSVLDHFGVPAKEVSAVPEAVRYAAGLGPDIVVAPDEGARAMCGAAAKALNCDHDVLQKERLDDRSVVLTLGELDVTNKRVLILDDIISTGGTIGTATRALKKQGADMVFAVAIHGLFIEDALNRLRDCDEIACSDTLEGVQTRFSVASALAKSLA